MNIAILDDHELIRMGLRIALEPAGHSVTIDAATAEQFFAAMEIDVPCDILILDILMPGTSGIEVAQRVRREYSDLKIIVNSVDTKEYVITQLMEIGIDGFVSKTGSVQDIRDAVQSVSEGVPYWGKDVAALIRDIVDARMDSTKSAQLTSREREIIAACCLGKQGKEIAREMNISLRTVNAHKTHIFAKLGLNNSVEMVRFAIEHGII